MVVVVGRATGVAKVPVVLLRVGTPVTVLVGEQADRLVPKGVVLVLSPTGEHVKGGGVEVDGAHLRRVGCVTSCECCCGDKYRALSGMI